MKLLIHLLYMVLLLLLLPIISTGKIKEEVAVVTGATNIFNWEPMIEAGLQVREDFVGTIIGRREEKQG